MLINLVCLFLYVSLANGDEKCLLTQHTYMAAIFYTSNDSPYFLGSGTLLSASWVLTSSVLMFYEESPQNYTVVAGAVSLAEYKLNKAHVQISLVKTFYYSKNKIRDVWDVVLIKLKNQIYKSKTVSYVNLATSSKNFKNKRLEDTCVKATMIGYNALSSNTKDLEPLQCTQVSVISQKQCQEKLANKLKLSFFMACSYRPNVDISYGNAGGPLMCNGVQYGVVTANYGGHPNIPSVFLKMDHYENFIRSKVELESGHFRESKCSSNYSIYLSVLILSFIFYLVTA